MLALIVTSTAMNIGCHSKILKIISYSHNWSALCTWKIGGCVKTNETNLSVWLSCRRQSSVFDMGLNHFFTSICSPYALTQHKLLCRQAHHMSLPCNPSWRDHKYHETTDSDASKADRWIINNTHTFSPCTVTQSDVRGAVCLSVHCLIIMAWQYVMLDLARWGKRYQQDTR